MNDMLHNKRRKSKGEKPCCYQRFRCKKWCKQRRGSRRDFRHKKLGRITVFSWLTVRPWQPWKAAILPKGWWRL